MPRINRPNHPVLPAQPAANGVPKSYKAAQASVGQTSGVPDTRQMSQRPAVAASSSAKSPMRPKSRLSDAARSADLPRIDQASSDAEDDSHLSDDKASALFAQWSQAPLVEAMGQLRDWDRTPGAIGHTMLSRLASGANTQATLQSWLMHPNLTSSQHRAYVQALETFIDVVGPQMPAAMVMAQLSVTNPFLARYNEHHTLLELLQNQLRKGLALRPEENLKALVCASFHLPCGHTDPGPGWVQGHVWLAAAQKLVHSKATDVCFVDMLTRVLPLDVVTMASKQNSGLGRQEGVIKVLLSWPGAEHLFQTSTLAWQRGVVDAREHTDIYTVSSHLVGPLHLMQPDPFDVITHHLNHLRRAADGAMLSPWWTSVHAKRAVQVLAALSDDAGQAIWHQVVQNLLHMPYQRIEPLRAFAAEMLRQKHLQLSGALIVELLAFEPMAYRFERFGEYYPGFWLKPGYLLEAAKADPKFVLDFVARHQSEILDPRLGFLDSQSGGAIVDKLGQLAMVHAPEDVPRLRGGQLRAKALRDIWTHLNDGHEEGAGGAFEDAIRILCEHDIDAQQVLGSRGILAEATSLVAHASPSAQVAIDRLFLWHSIISCVGIGDDYGVFENLVDETDCILDPLHPVYRFERNPNFALPQGLLHALETHVNLSPASRLDSPQLVDTSVVRRRQVVGRLNTMAAVAHCSASILDKRQDLIVALVTHPRAYEWPIASVALVLHCLRDGAKGEAAANLVTRLQHQSVPIDLVVSLQIMGAFGQAFLERSDVQYTVAGLLRKDSGAERAILQALADYGLTLVDATVPEFLSQAPSSPIFHILRGASSTVTAQVLIQQWTNALVAPGNPTAKQETSRLRRAKVFESMLREHGAAMTASLPRLADWDRVDAIDALQAVRDAMGEQRLVMAAPSKVRAGTAAAAPGLFAAKTNVRAVQQFYGDSLFPITLALLRHHPSLIQLRNKAPHELVQMLNGLTTPAQVLGAVPRLLGLDAWGKLDVRCAARPEALALSIKYAHGLETMQPEWSQGFKQLLGDFARGAWQNERLRHSALLDALQATPGTPRNWTERWMQGFELPIAPKALQGTDRSCRLVDSDSFLHMFFSGTDVTGSCQNINGSAALNCGLLSRMQMASKRLVAIVDDREKIFARAVFYLVEQHGEGHALFMGPVYVATQADRDETTKLLFDFARLRARQLGLPLLAADMLSDAPSNKLQSIDIETMHLPDYIDGEGMVTEVCELFVFETDVTKESLKAPELRSS